MAQPAHIVKAVAMAVGITAIVALVIGVTAHVLIARQTEATPAPTAARLFMVSPTTVTLNEDGSGCLKLSLYIHPDNQNTSQSHQVNMRLESLAGKVIERYDPINVLAKTDGRPSYLSVQIPSSTAEAAKDGNVRLVVDCPTVEDKKMTFGLDVHKPKGFIFIHTNKPVYRQGETVTIRVLTTDDRLVPKARSYKLSLTSPEGTVISEICPRNDLREIFNCSYELPSHASFGKWVLSAKSEHNSSSTKSFHVVKETRKPFHIDLDIPYKVITNATRWLDFNVKARENMGGAILGMAYVDVFLLVGSTKIGPLYHRTLELSPKGELAESVNISKIILAKNGRFHAEELFCSHLEVSAGVIDRLGRHHAVKDDGIQFAEFPYTIINNRKSSYYHEGIDYMVDLSIKHINGSIARGLPVKVIYKSDDPKSSRDEQFISIKRTDEMGRITQNLHKPNHWQVILGPEQMRQTFEYTVASSSEPAIALVLDKSIVSGKKVNDIIKINVKRTSTIVGENYSYMYSTNGKVLGNGTKFGSSFEIQVTEEMFPVIAVTVWLVKDGKVMNDSTHIHIKNPCEPKRPELFELQDRTITPSGHFDMHYMDDFEKMAIKAVDMATFQDQEMSRTDTSEITDAIEQRYSSGLDFQIGGPTTSDMYRHPVPETRNPRCPKVNRKEGTWNHTRCKNEGEKVAREENVENLETHRCIEVSLRAFSEQSDNCINSIFRGCLEVLMERVKTNNNARTSDSQPGDYGKLVHKSSSDVPLRENFKETWIFGVFDRPNIVNGERKMKFVAPDAITTWSIQAIGISPNRSLCLRQENAVTRRETFMTVSAPSTVIVLEEFYVRIFIHNLGENSKRLKLKVEYDQARLCGKSRIIWRKKVFVAAGNTKLITLPFVAIAAGPANITLRTSSDALRKTIYIRDSAEKPEREGDIEVEVKTPSMTDREIHGINNEPSGEVIDEAPPTLGPVHNSGARSRRSPQNTKMYKMRIKLRPKVHADRWTMNVGIPTGYIINNESLYRNMNELNVLSYDELVNNVILNFHLAMHETMNIEFIVGEGNRKRSLPSTITVHPHTRPHTATVKRYHFEDIPYVPLVCQKKSLCRCFHGRCPEQSTNANHGNNLQGEELGHMVCESSRGYAFKAKVDNIEHFSLADNRGINVTVEESYFCETDEVQPGEKRLFLMKKACVFDEFLKPNSSYIFIGRTPEGHNGSSAYWLDSHVLVLPETQAFNYPDTTNTTCKRLRQKKCSGH